MSTTPVVGSVDVNVSEASHLSKMPSMATDAFTWNLIRLASGVTSKTGASPAACPRFTEGNKSETRTHKTVIRMDCQPPSSSFAKVLTSILVRLRWEGRCWFYECHQERRVANVARFTD